MTGAVGWRWLGWLALALCACSSDKTPDSGVSGRDAEAADSGEADGSLPEKDGSILVVHDAGGPIVCNVTCDCPQGLACVSGACAALGTPVWCCEKPGCPKEQQCLDGADQPDLCMGDPDPADAGPPRDVGPGKIGDYCEADQDCDQAQSFVCWERFEPPYFWGYCAQENCLQTPCPTGSECVHVSDTPPIDGCMQACTAEMDCRSDAFCYQIPMAGFGVCIPDCRDDVFDCYPFDGSVYCNPSTGVYIPSCEPTPSHNNSALIGDACVNSIDCATGDICMGETGWSLDDGMCTHVCSGVPEATPCPVGSTCQFLSTAAPPYDQLGYCFRDCVGATCPDRVGATCDVLDPAWLDPACVPPLLP